MPKLLVILLLMNTILSQSCRSLANMKYVYVIHKIIIPSQFLQRTPTRRDASCKNKARGSRLAGFNGNSSSLGEDNFKTWTLSVPINQINSCRMYLCGMFISQRRFKSENFFKWKSSVGITESPIPTKRIYLQ